VRTTFSPSGTAAGLLAAGVLAAAILAVHGPGLTAAPQWDLTQYFVERQAWPAFGDALHKLDYSLSRTYWKGDEGQYRPLSMLLLAVQYELFGADMRWWHAASLALHYGVALLFFRTLSRRLTFSFALPLSTLFSVMFASVGLVQVSWVGGYMAGCALMLAALQTAWTLLGRDQVSGVTSWIRCVALVTLSTFFFEVFAVFSLILAIALWVLCSRRGFKVPGWLVLLWLTPVIIFAAFYLPRIAIAPRFFFVGDLAGASVLDAEHLASYPLSVVEYFFRWGVATALPTVRPFRPILFTTNIGILLAIAVVVWRNTDRRELPPDAASRSAICGALLLGYVAVVRFGRVATDDTHRYMFALIAVAMLGTLFEYPRLMDRARRVLVCLLVALALVNASIALRVTRQLGRNGETYVRYLSSLDRFVREHRKEPGFSFHVDREPAFVPPVVLLEGYPDRPVRVTEKRLWQTFLGAIDDPSKAVYSLEWEGTALVIR
jgi:hypothetical protein